jgi:hypothetical protein
MTKQLTNKNIFIKKKKKLESKAKLDLVASTFSFIYFYIISSMGFNDITNIKNEKEK